MILIMTFWQATLDNVNNKSFISFLYKNMFIIKSTYTGI